MVIKIETLLAFYLFINTTEGTLRDITAQTYFSCIDLHKWTLILLKQKDSLTSLNQLIYNMDFSEL